MKRIFAVAILMMATVFGQAQQRPLLTDDVDITPSGSLNISAGADFLQNVRFPLSGLSGDQTRVGDLRIRQGFAPNVELQIEGTLQNFLAINSRGVSHIPLQVSNNSTNDFDDFVISTKIKLRNETKNFPAIGYKFGFQMPNTDQAKGIGMNQINLFSKIIAQKKFGKKKGLDPAANIYGNIGLAILSSPLDKFSQNDVIIYGLAGIFRITKSINLVSEVNGRINTRSGTPPVGTESLSQFRIGTQIKASGLRFDTAAIIGLTKNSPRSGITFGVTYQSPKIFSLAQ